MRLRSRLSFSIPWAIQANGLTAWRMSHILSQVYRLNDAFMIYAVFSSVWFESPRCCRYKGIGANFRNRKGRSNSNVESEANYSSLSIAVFKSFRFVNSALYRSCWVLIFPEPPTLSRHIEPVLGSATPPPPSLSYPLFQTLQDRLVVFPSGLAKEGGPPPDKAAFCTPAL